MDSRVTEFHCIMPIANIDSVMTHGILSHERVAKLEHLSVALQPVQDKRDQKKVPGGLKLHQYANLYFHARNPMLYKRQNEAQNLCILQISTAVLKGDRTVITDCNAASDYVRFLSPSQLSVLNFDDIYAADWRHPGNPARFYQHKSRKCAEVLVPHLAKPNHLSGAYVVDDAARARIIQLGFKLPVSIDPVLFFR